MYIDKKDIEKLEKHCLKQLNRLNPYCEEWEEHHITLELIKYYKDTKDNEVDFTTVYMQGYINGKSDEKEKNKNEISKDN